MINPKIITVPLNNSVKYRVVCLLTVLLHKFLAIYSNFTMALPENFEPEEMTNQFEPWSTTEWVAISVCLSVLYGILGQDVFDEIAPRFSRVLQLYSTVSMFAVSMMMPYLPGPGSHLWALIVGLITIFIWLIIFSILIIIHVLIISKLMHYISSWIDTILYDHLYEIINGPPPTNIYELNVKYDNIYECPMCFDPFCRSSYGDESILSCGHRYHSGCLREWETAQFNRNSQYSKQCPVCKQAYNWHGKWNYYVKTL